MTENRGSTTELIYRPSRPIMTAEELRRHHVDAHGRDYSRADDGFDEMENNSEEGWRPVAGWGLDGWHLGEWPYAVISHRTVSADRFELLSVVEGDHDRYSFETEADRESAIDYLFLWYGLGKEYDRWTAEGLTPDKREALDAGTLRVPNRFRGPFSWARLDAEKTSV